MISHSKKYKPGAPVWYHGFLEVYSAIVIDPSWIFPEDRDVYNPEKFKTAGGYTLYIPGAPRKYVICVNPEKLETRKITPEDFEITLKLIQASKKIRQTSYFKNIIRDIDLD